MCLSKEQCFIKNVKKNFKLHGQLSIFILLVTYYYFVESHTAKSYTSEQYTINTKFGSYLQSTPQCPSCLLRITSLISPRVKLFWLNTTFFTRLIIHQRLILIPLFLTPVLVFMAFDFVVIHKLE